MNDVVSNGLILNRMALEVFKMPVVASEGHLNEKT